MFLCVIADPNFHLQDEEDLEDAIEERSYQNGFIGLLQILAYLIDRISCEVIIQ